MMIDDFRPPGRTDRQSKSLNVDNNTFQTPEEVAANDSIKREAELPKTSVSMEKTTIMPNYSKRASKRQGSRKYRLHFPSTKKGWVVTVVLLALVIVAIVLILGHNPKIESTLKSTISEPTQSNTVASRLTGVKVSKALAQLPVTGVMIENSDDARPQSGLSQAGVIFEALAEGGITRFMALYEEGQPNSIGPVRSARPYFIDWILPFNAAYAHVGGSTQALNEIQSAGVRDMNQYYNGGAYTRVSSRPAPHNVYTSMANLLSLESSKGWTSSNFVGFPRKTDNPAKIPTATNIAFNISSSDMNVTYQYAATRNDYARSEGGATMIDANTGKQLTPKVVIAMVVPWTNGTLDTSGAYYTDYSDIGSGTAYIFQDGNETTGTWQKASQNSQVQFMTTAGSPIKLDAGQTWITAVGTASEVTYSH